MKEKEKKRIRTLRDLAREINALNLGYTAKVDKSRSNTDRKIPGTRLISKGKGRDGQELRLT